MPFNNSSELYTIAPACAEHVIVYFEQMIKFFKLNETFSNPSQEKAHKRHNLLHKIGSVDYLEFYCPSKQICRSSPLPTRITNKKILRWIKSKVAVKITTSSIPST